MTTTTEKPKAQSGTCPCDGCTELRRREFGPGVLKFGIRITAHDQLLRTLHRRYGGHAIAHRQRQGKRGRRGGRRG